jgi:hypothetical protein
MSALQIAWGVAYGFTATFQREVLQRDTKSIVSFIMKDLIAFGMQSLGKRRSKVGVGKRRMIPCGR